MIIAGTIPHKLAQLGLHGMAEALEKQQSEPKFTDMPFECWRRSKIDQPYRLKFDQGSEPVFGVTGCG